MTPAPGAPAGLRSLPRWTDAEILAARPPRESVTPDRPYAFLVEPERTADGHVEDVATVFLTNRECPFRCLMCDLWKHTTLQTVPIGAIPRQIDHALSQLPPAHHVKLYNSGNFFDHRAIPPADYSAIADRVRSFRTVVVENHPRLCGDDIKRFRDMIEGRLEVAMGLETVHPETLASLNKRMTLEDFDRAVEFLLRAGVAVRAFILLNPPGMDASEGASWALRSVDHALGLGVGCCSVIPTRPGNGAVDRLATMGLFSRPTLRMLETTFDEGLSLAAGRGRVFADLWDVDGLADCPRCVDRRVARLRRMNLRQVVEPPIECGCR